MSTLTIIAWFCSVSIATSFGFLAGTWMTKRVPIDTGASAVARRKRFILGSRGQRSEPHLVLISPTELRAVKS